MNRLNQDYFGVFPDRLDLLKAAAESRELRKTPFFQGSCALGAGGGIDCIETVQWLYIKGGLYQEPVEFPVYSLTHGKHTNESIILRYFRTHPTLKACFREIAPEDTTVGDAPCYSLAARCVNHISLLFKPGYTIHCSTFGGVETVGYRPVGFTIYRPGKRLVEVKHITSFRPIISTFNYQPGGRYED